MLPLNEVIWWAIVPGLVIGFVLLLLSMRKEYYARGSHTRYSGCGITLIAWLAISWGVWVYLFLLYVTIFSITNSEWLVLGFLVVYSLFWYIFLGHSFLWKLLSRLYRKVSK